MAANAGNVTNGTPEQLHQLMDKVEKHLDQTRQLRETVEGKIAALEARPVPSTDGPTAEQFKEVSEAISGQAETLRLVEERLRNLDSALPVGEKIYRPIVPDQDTKTQAVREQIARTVLDLGCTAKNYKRKFESEYFRTQTEGVQGDGGYLMPIEYRAEIIRIVQQYGVARKLFRIMPMAHKDWQVPTNSDLPTVYWDTQLNAVELAAPNESKVTFARPQMTAHKLIAIDTLSLELSEDSIPSIANFVVDLFGIAISKEEDNQAFMSDGSGSNPFTGLMKLSGITDVPGAANTYAGCLQATGATGGYNQLLTVSDSVDEAVVDSATWVMSNSVLNAVRQVKDLHEQPLFGTMTGTSPLQLFGRPIVRARIMPKVKDGGDQSSSPFIIFGDFNFQIMGDRMQLTIDVSPHAAFKEAGLVMRVMERIGYVNTLKTPFARLVTSA